MAARRTASRSALLRWFRARPGRCRFFRRGTCEHARQLGLFTSSFFLCLRFFWVIHSRRRERFFTFLVMFISLDAVSVLPFFYPLPLRGWDGEGLSTRCVDHADPNCNDTIPFPFLFFTLLKGGLATKKETKHLRGTVRYAGFSFFCIWAWHCGGAWEHRRWLLRDGRMDGWEDGRGEAKTKAIH